MIYIPTSEIKQPQLHADTLGFTFVWKGHFLRGIYPQSEALAKSYFKTGFLDEVVSHGYFPKTWISEYENELFCMILEHELIQPILFATEWNSAMLKDAALMVIDLAEAVLSSKSKGAQGGDRIKVIWNHTSISLICGRMVVIRLPSA